MNNSFNFNEYLKIDQMNRKVASHNLKPYWSHFEDAVDLYNRLYYRRSAALLADEFVPRLFFLGGCYVNLVKSVSSIVAGHLHDSNIFTRRTVESIRYSMFIRENPKENELWLKGATDERAAKKFKKKFDNWHFEEKGGGCKIVESELEGAKEAYKIAADFGPHPNQNLLTRQNQITKTEKGYQTILWFHDCDSTEQGAWRGINQFLWHLSIHLRCIEWWHNKSGVPFNLGAKFTDDMQEALACHQLTMHRIKPQLQAMLFPNHPLED